MKFSLDPRAKLLILLMVNITIFVLTDIYTELACIVLICATMLYHKRFSSCIKYIAMYTILVLLIMVTMRYQNKMTGMLFVFLLLIRKVIPTAMFASLLISSTQVSEMVAALQKIHIPRSITIALVVTMRFFPTIWDEFSYILDATKVRGIHFSAKNILQKPLVMMEYIMVPMILRLSSVAEELSAAAVTRGIDSPKQRTSYHEIRFGFMDVVFILLFGAIMISAITGGVEAWI